MERYTIIDEPRTRPWGEKLVVDPVIVLLAAMLVPLFWNPPYMGRFWLPVLWLIFNGAALGSSTLKKEVGLFLKGGLLFVAVFHIAIMLPTWSDRRLSVEAILPYSQIAFFAVFFMTLYLVVFEQSRRASCLSRVEVMRYSSTFGAKTDGGL